MAIGRQRSTDQIACPLHRPLSVMLTRDALQNSLPAIVGVERLKRSDELIEKRGLGSQKHCRRGRYLATVEAKEISLLDRGDQQLVWLVVVKTSPERAAGVLGSSVSRLQIE
jgi:hypothetical protein